MLLGVIRVALRFNWSSSYSGFWNMLLLFGKAVFATVALGLSDSVRCSECCLSARDFDET